MHSGRPEGDSVRDSALWGLVGAMLFVVLALGYRIATGSGVGLSATLAVAAGVGLMTAALSAVVDGYLG